MDEIIVARGTCIRVYEWGCLCRLSRIPQLSYHLIVQLIRRLNILCQCRLWQSLVTKNFWLALTLWYIGAIAATVTISCRHYTYVTSCSMSHPAVVPAAVRRCEPISEYPQLVAFWCAMGDSPLYNIYSVPLVTLLPHSFPRSDCGRRFSCEAGYNEHLSTHINYGHKCPVTSCYQSFPTLKRLELHCRAVHNTSELGMQRPWLASL